MELEFIFINLCSNGKHQMLKWYNDNDSMLYEYSDLDTIVLNSFRIFHQRVEFEEIDKEEEEVQFVFFYYKKSWRNSWYLEKDKARLETFLSIETSFIWNVSYIFATS